jgi:hypothetical protein
VDPSLIPEDQESLGDKIPVTVNLNQEAPTLPFILPRGKVYVSNIRAWNGARQHIIASADPFFIYDPDKGDQVVEPTENDLSIDAFGQLARRRRDVGSVTIGVPGGAIPPGGALAVIPIAEEDYNITYLSANGEQFDPATGRSYTVEEDLFLHNPRDTKPDIRHNYTFLNVTFALSVLSADLNASVTGPVTVTATDLDITWDDALFKPQWTYWDPAIEQWQEVSATCQDGVNDTIISGSSAGQVTVGAHFCHPNPAEMCAFNATENQTICRDATELPLSERPGLKGAVQFALMLRNIFFPCDPPVALDVTMGPVSEGTTASLFQALLYNDTEGDPARFEILSLPQLGLLVSPLNTTEPIEYRLQPYVYGLDSFTFRVIETGFTASGRVSPCGEMVSENVGTVFIDIRPVNDPPILSIAPDPSGDAQVFEKFGSQPSAKELGLIIEEDSSITFDIMLEDRDIDQGWEMIMSAQPEVYENAGLAQFGLAAENTTASIQVQFLREELYPPFGTRQFYRVQIFPPLNFPSTNSSASDNVPADDVISFTFKDNPPGEPEESLTAGPPFVVTLTVLPLNDPPVAVASVFRHTHALDVDPTVTLRGPLDYLDVDHARSELSFSLVHPVTKLPIGFTRPLNNSDAVLSTSERATVTLVLDENGTLFFEYSLLEGETYSETDSFEWLVSDGISMSQRSTMSIQVDITGQTECTLCGGPLAGLIVGLIVLVAIILFIIFIVYKRRKAEPKPQPDSDEIPMDERIREDEMIVVTDGHAHQTDGFAETSVDEPNYGTANIAGAGASGKTDETYSTSISVENHYGVAKVDTRASKESQAAEGDYDTAEKHEGDYGVATVAKPSGGAEEGDYDVALHNKEGDYGAALDDLSSDDELAPAMSGVVGGLLLKDESAYERRDSRDDIIPE